MTRQDDASKPIGTARLAALPAAACCADCARLVAA